jgi:cytochrome c biogenesis protein CcmG/thiol:disulfide interchange protein DsbE
MRRFLVPGLASLAAVAFIVVLAIGISDQGTSSSIDAQVAHGHFPPAPSAAVRLPVLGGPGRESLAALRGKVVLINVFASWCVPCAGEAPILERVEHMLAVHGGTVLGVTYLDTPSDAAGFMRDHHLTFPVIRDVNGDFVRSFGTTGVPENFVIGRTGRIEGLLRGPIDNHWVSQTLPKILAQKS